MLSTLINGKHYKQVVIDYYDDLIARLDIEAEVTLEKFKNDDEFNKYENKKALICILNSDDLFQEENEQFKDPFSAKYTFGDELLGVSNKSHVLFQDFVHAERMRGINEMKQLQKNRLEEIKLAKTKPTSIEDALFGENKFGFLVKIKGRNLFVETRMKFRLVAVVTDFYLDNDQIEEIENLVALDFDEDDYCTLVKDEHFDEKCLQVILLARYLRDQLEHNLNGECVKRVSKKQLYATEKIVLFVKSELRKPLRIFAFDGPIDLSRVKSLRYEQCYRLDMGFYQTYRYDCLDLSGLSNLECLELEGIKLDLKHDDPFMNIDTTKLRQLRLDCNIANLEMNFFEKFLNLEILSLNFYNWEQNSVLLQSLSGLKNLKLLSLFGIKTKNYNFLKEMSSLVTLNIYSKRNCPIAEDTFKELKNLETLNICAKKGKWMRYLTRLRSLWLRSMGSEDDQDDLTRLRNLLLRSMGSEDDQDDDMNYFDYLPNLCQLKISDSSHIEGSLIGLKKLERLSLELSNTIEKNFFEGLDKLTALELCDSEIRLDTFKGSHSLSLSKLSILRGRVEMDSFDSFSNLKCLKLIALDSLELNFSEHQNLTRLEISECDWSHTLPDNFFMNLRNLTELHISTRDVNIVANANIYNGLENLIEFCVQFYNVDNATFNVDILSRMPKLQRLFIDNCMENSVDINVMKTQFPNLYVRYCC